MNREVMVCIDFTIICAFRHPLRVGPYPPPISDEGGPVYIKLTPDWIILLIFLSLGKILNRSNFKGEAFFGSQFRCVGHHVRDSVVTGEHLGPWWQMLGAGHITPHPSSRKADKKPSRPAPVNCFHQLVPMPQRFHSPSKQLWQLGTNIQTQEPVGDASHASHDDSPVENVSSVC